MEIACLSQVHQFTLRETFSLKFDMKVTTFIQHQCFVIMCEVLFSLFLNGMFVAKMKQSVNARVFFLA